MSDLLTEGEMNVAKRNQVVVDGTFVDITPGKKTLQDVVPAEAQAVISSGGEIIQRADFARRPIPEGFETMLAAQVKG